MSRFQELTELFRRRLLTAAQRGLSGPLDPTAPGYEEELQRQRKLLEVVLVPEIKLRRADVQQSVGAEEHVPCEQQGPPEPPHIKEEQEDPPEPPHIKEEQEEVWTSRQGEQLQGPEEAHITEFPLTPVPVKSEDDEEEAQSSQLHHRHTEHMETEADGEDCGGPEPDRNPHPRGPLEAEDQTGDCSEAETALSDKDWEDLDRKSFGCSACGKTFKHRGNLNIHMRTHTGVKPFSCSLCGKKFTQKAGLDYHVKTHTGERPFSCSICGKTFRHKGALTYHMATHTGVKPFSCSDCGKRFRGTSQLKIHKCVGESSQHHRGQSDKRQKPLSCSECEATFPNNYLLVTHMRMHKGKKLFTCTVCGQKRQFRSHLEIHMRTHTGEKPYSCSVCGKRFSQRGIMTQHMAVHSGVKPFGCSDCGRRFFWQFQVKKHKCAGESLQRRGAVLNGEDCGRPGSARDSDPQRYLKQGINEKMKSSFDTDDSTDIDFWKETRQHQSGFTYRRNKKVCVTNGYNAGERPSSCSDDTANTEQKSDDIVNVDFCKQTRQRPAALNLLKSDAGMKTFSSTEYQKRSEDCHTLQTHKKCPIGEKPFSCLFCGNGFATGGYLTRHISIHTGEKLLSCVVCEKRFALELELTSHVCVGASSQLHLSNAEELGNANKLFSCSRCGRRFGRKHQLQVHMRTHTGEKPFCCSVCNTGFSDSESLVKHMRIHTGQTQFSCSICGKEFAWRRYLTKHMEVHAKQKIYRCSICDRGFTRIYQLKYHQCAGGQSSQLHLQQAEENREAEPPASSSAQHMETEADGEDCGGPGPDRNPHPRGPLEAEDQTEDSSETETDDSVDDQEETREAQSALNSLRYTEVSQTDTETFYNNNLQKNHVRFISSGEKQFTGRGSVTAHTGGTEQDPEPPHIKEEQEQVWISEAHITEFPLTPVPVKSEDDEEEAQSSQLHHRHTEHMETEADGEDCGGPGPDRNPHPRGPLEAETEDQTLVSFKSEDSVDSDFWKETRERPSGLNSLTNEGRVMGCSKEKASESLEPESDDSADSDFWKDDRKPQLHSNPFKNNDVSESEMGSDALRKPYSCSECGKRFLHTCNLKNHMRFHTGEKAFFCSVCGQKCLYRSHLQIHMRTHTGEKPFICPVCGKKYAHKASMQSHMIIHTMEKQYNCSVCDKGFAWFTELKYHQCVGESSHENLH
ncbi:zinc finger protein 845-like [Pempheris klunzingeri]|uniref:zinc finger protein 845-like n=1 Tax=Pempheris klunzingeri TaxID=3127111 RepID=UPI003980A6C3